MVADRPGMPLGLATPADPVGHALVQHPLGHVAEPVHTFAPGGAGTATTVAAASDTSRNVRWLGMVVLYRPTAKNCSKGSSNRRRAWLGTPSAKVRELSELFELAKMWCGEIRAAA
jgi:hypothetical protein